MPESPSSASNFIASLRDDLVEFRRENNDTHRDIMTRLEGVSVAVGTLGRTVAVNEVNIHTLCRDQQRSLELIEELDGRLTILEEKEAERRGAAKKAGMAGGGVIAIVITALVEALRHTFSK